MTGSVENDGGGSGGILEDAVHGISGGFVAGRNNHCIVAERGRSVTVTQAGGDGHRIDAGGHEQSGVGGA